MADIVSSQKLRKIYIERKTQRKEPTFITANSLLWANTEKSK